MDIFGLKESLNVFFGGTFMKIEVFQDQIREWQLLKLKVLLAIF